MSEGWSYLNQLQESHPTPVILFHVHQQPLPILVLHLHEAGHVHHPPTVPPVLPLHGPGHVQVRQFRKFVIFSFPQVAKADICNHFPISYPQVAMAAICNTFLSHFSP